MQRNEEWDRPYRGYGNGEREQNVRLDHLEQGQAEMKLSLAKIEASIASSLSKIEAGQLAIREELQTVVRRIKDDKVPMESRLTKLEERVVYLQRLAYGGLSLGTGSTLGHLPALIEAIRGVPT